MSSVYKKTQSVQHFTELNPFWQPMDSTVYTLHTRDNMQLGSKWDFQTFTLSTTQILPLHRLSRKPIKICHFQEQPTEMTVTPWGHIAITGSSEKKVHVCPKAGDFSYQYCGFRCLWLHKDTFETDLWKLLSMFRHFDLGGKMPIFQLHAWKTRCLWNSMPPTRII